MGDQTKLSEFFNELELNEDISDLLLLVEAERLVEIERAREDERPCRITGREVGWRG